MVRWSIACGRVGAMDLLPAATVLASLITAAVALRSSNAAIRITKANADAALKLAKAQRADPMAQLIFSAKLESYRELFGLVVKANDAAKDLIFCMMHGKLETWGELHKSMCDAKNSVDECYKKEHFLHSLDARGATLEMAKKFSWVISHLPARIGPDVGNNLGEDLANCMYRVGAAFARDLNVPKIETITSSTVEQGAVGYEQTDNLAQGDKGSSSASTKKPASPVA